MLHIKHLTQALEALSVRAQTQLTQRAQAAQQALTYLRTVGARNSLQARLERAEPGWDGARPLERDIPLAQVFTAAAAPPAGTVALGVDGSQIFPDRHAAVPYYVLQVGWLRFSYDGSAPQGDGYAELHYEGDENLDERDGFISPRLIGLQRMVLEMEKLAEQVEVTRAAYPDAEAVYAFSDGPLAWSSYGQEGPPVQELCERYLTALERVQAAGGVPVGYVERPGGTHLLELLKLPPTTDEAPEAAALINLPPYLRDRDVMALHLASGQRTPWFERYTPAHERHAARGQGLVFCYLNAGGPYPVIARVELPRWAIAHSETVFSLLNHQNALLGGYPYLLMRAHELAVITSEDKAQLEQALQQVIWQKQRVALRPSEKARYKSTLARRK